MLPVYPWNPYQRLLSAALREAGWETVLLATERRRSSLLRGWWRAGRPPVVHLHWAHDFLGGSRGRPRRATVLWFSLQLRLLALLGVRLVWTAHNLTGHEGEGEKREVEAHRRLVERADAVIVHCEDARRLLVETYRPSDRAAARVHVVPHGSYVGHYADELDQAEARRRLGVPEGGPVFAFVGAIRAYKGVLGLLEAFMRLEAAGPEARLLVWGKPLPKRLGVELETVAVADPRILLRLERSSDEELTTVVRAADAVVLPFRDILTSGTVILALSLGRAVIAPRLGCLPDTVPAGAGLLYDPDEPDGLGAAMRAILAGDLAEMGRRARARAEELSWGPIARLTAQLYEG
jgi:glycosyltransferase involved in cell wall biosynthesis